MQVPPSGQCTSTCDLVATPPHPTPCARAPVCAVSVPIHHRPPSARARLQVNAKAAARLLLQQEAATVDAAVADTQKAAAAGRTKAPAPNPLADDRFKAMFEDAAFTIDERSEEYRALHPNVGRVRSPAVPRT